MPNRIPPSPRNTPLLLVLLTLLSATGLLAQQAGTSPVKIFILAGQSNMLGHGEISPLTTPGTLEYTVANDPDGDYQFLVDGSGAWVVRDDVWIRDQDPSQGGLTVGYGAQLTLVGPELGFGHLLGDLQESQVLIVKAAWGGKSLSVDFRPPSSGGTTGFYYDEILRLVTEATTNLGTYFPDYDNGGYEIAGFGWHQGWNDRVTPAFAAEYETNMANFIRDIRTDLGVPALPFVIATTGMDGGTTYSDVELAQRAMTDPYLTNPAPTDLYTDFVGSVAVIDTRTTYEGMEFWQPVGSSPANQGYHWNRNAKTYVNIGLAMGDAMSLMVPGRCPFRPRVTGGPGGVTLTWENGTEVPTSVRILRDSVEIAAAAPTSPTSFLDTTAQPGVLDYELIFTMPGDPCDPLTTTLNGGITGLELTPSPGSFALTWTNNMAYTSIEVRRDGTLLGSPLSGTATTFTDSSPPTSGVVTYSVAPTNGGSTPATVQINLDLSGQLGILDLTANGGINPNTGLAWEAGDQYRLAFHTVGSTGTRDARSNNPADYNTYVTAEAHANTALAGTAWKAMVSVNLNGGTTEDLSARMNVRDNTGTADLTGGSGVGGAGLPIYAMDGTTCIARNNADLWNGWSNPFDGDSEVRLIASQAVHYSPFLDQFGNQTVNPDDIHGIDVATGATINGNDANPLGDTSDNTTMNRGNANANSPGRVWERFTNNTTDTLSYYALSDPLTVISGTDTTAPTVVSFVDNVGGGPIISGDPVTYAVTFSESMNASMVDPGDFENKPSESATITVDSVAATGDPAVFDVTVTTTGTGTLQLRIAAGATLEDPAGNALDANAASPDNTIITVNADTTAPTLNSFVDDVGGGPIFVGDTVLYTVTFSEAMNAATVGTADFGNASGAAITIDTVSPTGNPAVFEVAVTATGQGTLRLRVVPSATLADPAGNALDANAARPDDTIITVNAPPALVGELGILNLAANGGINPNTGVAWEVGDQYRLAFHTDATIAATSNDPAVYDNFATAQANLSALGDGSITTSTGWTAMVWVNTASGQNQGLALSNPSVRAGITDTTGGSGVGGAGVPVYAMDGTTAIARNNAVIQAAWASPFANVDSGWGANGQAADSTLRLPVGAGNGNTQNVFYSPFLDQYGSGDTGAQHGADVWTGGFPGSHVNALGDAADDTTASRGSSNANNTGRVWNRFTSATTATNSVYALSAPLTVMAGGVGDPYGSWAANFTGLTNADPAIDFDLGGLGTGIEWVVGGDPSDPSDDAGNAPTVSDDGTHLVFTYQRRDEAEADGFTDIQVEWNLDLQGTWTEAIAGDGVVFNVTDGSPFDTVEVKIPMSLASPGTKLFARLRVMIAVP